MATAKCEITGFEGVTVEWPDEFTNGHENRYKRGQERAWAAYRASIKDGDGDDDLIPSYEVIVMFGVLQICSVTGIDIDLKTMTAAEWFAMPRSNLSSVLSWLVSVVGSAYQRAGEVPKNS